MRHASFDGARGCYIEAALEVIGDKWKGVILYHLLDEPKRFNELKRTFPELSQRILTKQLRELENDGVISRKIYPEIPPKVEYSLTDLGRLLEPTLLSLEGWGVKYIEMTRYLSNCQSDKAE
ncbi:transcriptional regulator, HxlR family [Gloeocapsa sp. PCC 7428]|uniref:winged helix-turn-helix transcriptional regulator n=1 Tax=Gloeocapsa sp. PCC 7428 TaxID=1173026 RepID=UPI0002A5C2A2|nr:helix-turn-helix domain-containing protein [Gloeocapsa sp. PCC 7428]AFZ32236.1 transcriptional regulator, HxlR family [Gloeocapsa sp. PCC 7428]